LVNQRETADAELIKRRYLAIQIAKECGNVEEACRQTNIDRTSFYKWRRRYEANGLDGLKCLPRVHKSYPREIPEETRFRIQEASLDHPSWGCKKLSDHFFKKNGLRVSPPAVQKILIKYCGGSSKKLRWEKLEYKYFDGWEDDAFSDEAIAFIEKWNPRFRERNNELERPGRPGQLLVLDVINPKVIRSIFGDVIKLKDIGSIFGDKEFYVIIDCFCGYVFVNKSDYEIFINEIIIPFYRKNDVSIEKILINLDMTEDFKKLTYEKIKRNAGINFEPIDKMNVYVEGMIKDLIYKKYYSNYNKKDIEGLINEYNSVPTSFVYPFYRRIPEKELESYFLKNNKS